MFTQTRITNIILAMKAQTGIDPTVIYCHTTGAPVGLIAPEELDLVFLTIDSKMDDDAVIDELYTRTLIAMRPSPVWTLIKPATINRIRVTNPRRMAAYMLGRYFEPRDLAYDRKRRSLSERLTDGANRIICYERLMAATDSDQLALKEFVNLLCLIDSDFELSLMDMIPDFPKTPLDLDVSNLPRYTEILSNYYAALLDKKSALEHQARLQESWMRNGGNRLARETRTNLIQELKAKADKAKPRTPRESARKAAEDSMSAVLKDWLSGDLKLDSVAAQPKTTPAASVIKPVFKMKLPGAFKMQAPKVEG